MQHVRSAKLHISLPADLYDFVSRRRAEHHVSMSAAIAESIRNDMAAERQARLDEALALDAEDNLAFAQAAGATAAQVIRPRD